MELEELEELVELEELEAMLVLDKTRFSSNLNNFFYFKKCSLITACLCIWSAVVLSFVYFMFGLIYEDHLKYTVGREGRGDLWDGYRRRGGGYVKESDYNRKYYQTV